MCGGSFMGTVPNQIGSALGGGANPLQNSNTSGGFFGGMTTPAPMQNPFLGGQGMSAAQMNPQQYRAAPVQNIDSVLQALGIPNDPGLTPYKLGQTLSAPSGGGTGQPIKFFDGDYSLGDLRDRMAAGRADTTNVFQPQGMTPRPPVPPPVQQPQRTFAGAKPNIKEFMDATGVDFTTAADILYGTVGSNTDTRKWKEIFASQDPVATARQATAAMYGGVQEGIYTDPVTGKQTKMLMSGTGIPLTSPGERAINFGMGLQPTNTSLVSGYATNERFPGAGTQQLQTPFSPQGQIPLQNPPTMNPVAGPTSQPQTIQDMIARARGLIGTQYGGGMGQPMTTQVSRPPVDVPQYGGGMGQPLSKAQLEAAVADDIATGRQIYRGPEGTQILQKLLQGTPSGANGPYPAQVSPLPVGGGLGQPSRALQQQLQAQLQAQQMRKMQRRQQQPAQGLGAGIGSLINRGMMF